MEETLEEVTRSFHGVKLVTSFCYNDFYVMIKTEETEKKGKCGNRKRRLKQSDEIQSATSMIYAIHEKTEQKTNERNSNRKVETKNDH